MAESFNATVKVERVNRTFCPSSARRHANLSDLGGELARIWAAEGVERSRAIDALVDWPQEFDARSGEIAGRALEVLLNVDDTDVVRESVLHALSELATLNRVPLDVLQRIVSDPRLRGQDPNHYLEALNPDPPTA